MSVLDVVGVVFCLGLILFILFGILWGSTGHPKVFKYIFHDAFGWHYPDNNDTSFDGCSWNSTCKYCGKKIMMDSQGSWF